jgi:membrane-associated phospholipid phosphatase
MLARAVRSLPGLRAVAWTVVAAGIAAPLARRRVRLPPAAVLGLAGAAPFALCVARPRTRARDAGTVMLQMWAYVAAYEMPADDPEALERRVRVDYPVRADRALGLGVPPGVRLQGRWARPDEPFRAWEKVLVWSHWMWFLVPHGTVAYFLLTHHDRFERAAVLTYATFDVGVIGYWLVPTAPPWYAAEHGRLEAEGTPPLQRMMVRYGEEFWAERWASLYDSLAGNPLAAMPSLHFATSVTAAALLAELGPGHAVVGWGYALTLGLALVYLGEHYVVDLLAGLALALGIRAAEPPVRPLLARGSRIVQGLEARARG